jgi:transcription elongation factor GreA
LENRGKIYVTASGAERLERELEELQKKRGEVAENIRTAKAYGDLSENFEYHEAKREQGFVEGRIQELKATLASLEVVPPEEVSTGQVGFGSVVKVREETGDEWEFLIVGPLEADPMQDRISYESPMGEALIGQKVGDEVEVHTPAGLMKYTITGISAYTG